MKKLKIAVKSGIILGAGMTFIYDFCGGEKLGIFFATMTGVMLLTMLFDHFFPSPGD